MSYIESKVSLRFLREEFKKKKRWFQKNTFGPRKRWENTGLSEPWLERRCRCATATGSHGCSSEAQLMKYSVKTPQVTSVGPRLWNRECTLLASVFAQSLRIIHLIPGWPPYRISLQGTIHKTGEGGGVNYWALVYSMHEAHTGVLTWVEGLEFFLSWNVLELPNWPERMPRISFLLRSLLLLTEASESSRATVTGRQEPPAGS